MDLPSKRGVHALAWEGCSVSLWMYYLKLSLVAPNLAQKAGNTIEEVTVSKVPSREGLIF